MATAPSDTSSAVARVSFQTTAPGNSAEAMLNSLGVTCNRWLSLPAHARVNLISGFFIRKYGISVGDTAAIMLKIDTYCRAQARPDVQTPPGARIGPAAAPIGPFGGTSAPTLSATPVAQKPPPEGAPFTLAPPAPTVTIKPPTPVGPVEFESFTAPPPAATAVPATVESSAAPSVSTPSVFRLPTDPVALAQVLSIDCATWPALSSAQKTSLVQQAVQQLSQGALAAGTDVTLLVNHLDQYCASLPSSVTPPRSSLLTLQNALLGVAVLGGGFWWYRQRRPAKKAKKGKA